MVRLPSFPPQAVFAERFPGRAKGPVAVYFRSGFTLVETVLALGIAMLFFAAIFTVLSVGLTNSKDASDDTVIGLILRETGNRIRGEALAAAPNTPLKFYFDTRGRFVDQAKDDRSKNAFLAVATVSDLASPPPNSNLVAVVVKVYSLTNPMETSIPTTAPKATFSLLKTTSAGKGWKKLDPTFEPKIDL
jgi:uncharacterized protein (TIGR02598 family)